MRHLWVSVTQDNMPDNAPIYSKDLRLPTRNGRRQLQVILADGPYCIPQDRQNEVLHAGYHGVELLARWSRRQAEHDAVPVLVRDFDANEVQPDLTELFLRGPLGHSLEAPKRAHRVALVALDRNPGRLLPLVANAIKQGAEIALFSRESSVNFPLVVEQQGLKELPSALKWADYLAADISLEKIENLDTIFLSRIPAALEAQILVAAQMPCGGMAKCGVCTVHTRRGPRLACEDGPVFDLQEFV